MLKLTKAQADEIRYKLDIIAYEEPELREDCGLTEAQADELARSVPVRGEWEIPAFGLKCVRDELENIATTRQDQSQGLVSEKERRKLRREMREFDSLAEQLSDIMSAGHIHQFFIVKDGEKIPGNRCQVEGCNTFTGVPVRQRKKKPTKPAPDPTNTGPKNGPKSLRNLLRFV